MTDYRAGHGRHARPDGKPGHDEPVGPGDGHNPRGEASQLASVPAQDDGGRRSPAMSGRSPATRNGGYDEERWRQSAGSSYDSAYRRPGGARPGRHGGAAPAAPATQADAYEAADYQAAGYQLGGRRASAHRAGAHRAGPPAMAAGSGGAEGQLDEVTQVRGAPGTSPHAWPGPAQPGSLPAGKDTSRLAGVAGEGGGGDGAGDGAEGAGPGPDATVGRRGRYRSRKPLFTELPVLIIAALLLALLLKTFVVQAFVIPTNSMMNTVDPGDKVLVSKLTYDFRSIHRGDIIVFNVTGLWAPEAPPPSSTLARLWGDFSGLFGTSLGNTFYIKRVIGLPGDKVKCCDARGDITVNGVELHEQSYIRPGHPAGSYNRAPGHILRFSVTVPPGMLWVMGDNRYVSADSRAHMTKLFPHHGFIPESTVVGRAFVIVYPLSRFRFLPIPATFDQPQLAAAAALPAVSPATSFGPAPASLLAGLLLPLSPAGPLALGFLGAVPVTAGQRRLRRRFARRAGGRVAGRRG